MSVVTDNAVQFQGEYVPFHTAGRGGRNGLVGTLGVDAQATGDAGGGSVTLNLNMRREEFGFPILWVPTVVSLFDNLATAENVIGKFESAGNRRLDFGLRQIATMVQVGADNVGIIENVTVPIEGIGIASARVYQAFWASNVDTKAYHLHMFGAVFDLQVIARLGEIDLLAAGMR